MSDIQIKCCPLLYKYASKEHGKSIHRALYYYDLANAIEKGGRTTLEDLIKLIKKPNIKSILETIKSNPKFFGLSPIKNSKNYYIYIRSLKRICVSFDIQEDIGATIHFRTAPASLREYRHECLIPSIAEASYIVNKKTDELPGRSHSRIAGALGLSIDTIKKWSAKRENKIHRKTIIHITDNYNEAKEYKNFTNYSKEHDIAYITIDSKDNPAVEKYLRENNLTEKFEDKKRLYLINIRLSNYYIATYQSLGFRHFDITPDNKARSQNHHRRNVRSKQHCKITGPDCKIRLTTKDDTRYCTNVDTKKPTRHKRNLKLVKNT